MSLDSNERQSPAPKMGFESKMDRLELRLGVDVTVQSADQAKLEAKVLTDKCGDTYGGFKGFIERYQATWTFSADPLRAAREYQEISANLKSFGLLYEKFRQSQNDLIFAKKLGIERMVEPRRMIEGALGELITDPAELSLIGLFALTKAAGSAEQKTLQPSWAKSYFVLTTLPALVKTATSKAIL